METCDVVNYTFRSFLYQVCLGTECDFVPSAEGLKPTIGVLIISAFSSYSSLTNCLDVNHQCFNFLLSFLAAINWAWSFFSVSGNAAFLPEFFFCVSCLNLRMHTSLFTQRRTDLRSTLKWKLVWAIFIPWSQCNLTTWQLEFTRVRLSFICHFVQIQTAVLTQLNDVLLRWRKQIQIECYIRMQWYGFIIQLERIGGGGLIFVGGGGGLYLEVGLCLKFRGLIFGGAYFRGWGAYLWWFTVYRLALRAILHDTRTRKHSW